MAAYSRFIRPGAARVHALTPDPAVKATAFRNTDGTSIIELLNTATTPVRTTLTTRGAPGGRPATYLTSESHSLTRTDAATRHGSQLTVELPPRSLTTIVLNR
jgi:glucosylceramidase